jgi:hypothetical protein
VCRNTSMFLSFFENRKGAMHNWLLNDSVWAVGTCVFVDWGIRPCFKVICSSAFTWRPQIVQSLEVTAVITCSHILPSICEKFSQFPVSNRLPNREHPKILVLWNVLYTLPVRTVATAVKAMCKYCCRFSGCDSSPHSQSDFTSKFVFLTLSVIPSVKFWVLM